jgi:phosphatidate phosphatase APP1
MQVFCGITDFDGDALKLYEERARLLFNTWNSGGKWRRQQLEARICTPWASTLWQLLPAATDKKGRFKTDFNFSDIEAGLDRRTLESVILQVRLANETVLPASNATVYLVGQEGLSVISDIDDTVKISEVYKGKRALLENAFTREFQAVESMAALFRSWVRNYGANFQFVSKSPPAFHEPLNEFLIREGFPNASLHLCPLFSKERSMFKEKRIEAILEEFPARKFVLVGDSGETDPEVYATISRKHPEQVVKILVREVDPSLPVDPVTFEGIDPQRWQVFRHPDEITLPLPPLKR